MTNDVALRRRVIRVVGLLVAFLLIIEVISDVVFIAVWRSRWRPGIEALRWFNKKVQNPVILKMAGRPNREVAALHHRGRRSGREYVVPVSAQRTGRVFLIPLPYGTDVDWCRNVLASGGCVIEHKGVRYDAATPVVFPASEAAPRLASRWQRRLSLMGVESCLELDIDPAGQSAETTG